MVNNKLSNLSVPQLRIIINPYGMINLTRLYLWMHSCSNVINIARRLQMRSCILTSSFIAKLLIHNTAS